MFILFPCCYKKKKCVCVYNNPARPRRAAKAPPKAGTLTADAAPVSNVEAAEEAAEPVAEDWEPVAEAAEPVDETMAEVLTAVAAEAEEADLRLQRGGWSATEFNFRVRARKNNMKDMCM